MEEGRKEGRKCKQEFKEYLLNISTINKFSYYSSGESGGWGGEGVGDHGLVFVNYLYIRNWCHITGT